MNVGLIGCGAIGLTLARAIVDGKAGYSKLTAVCDIDKTRLENFKKEFSSNDLHFTMDVDEIIKHKEIDLVIEAASRIVVKEVAEKVLENGKDMLIMSVGALCDDKLFNIIKEMAIKNKVKIYIPSGAICGLDGVKGASIGNIYYAQITSTKHPRSLAGAPYVVENQIDLSNLIAPAIIFEGSARQAIDGFPKSVNVAIALSIAGIGVDKTKVTIIANPNATRTCHEIKVEGDFGELTTKVRNHVHPNNPKTSYLAALAAIRTIKNLSDPIKLGT